MGLPADIYKVFWPKIKHLLLAYYLQAFEEKRFSISARRGILSLIPKKDKNLQSLNNWRPLTLLNMDYKLLSKLLALQIQPYLQEIISPHQTCFMKNRNITVNIRKALETMRLTQDKKLCKILLSLDFEKCFDSIKMSAIENSLRFFGICEDYIQWVKLLFTDFLLSIQNNGKISNWFQQHRGYHQGCCYSPYGFLISGEVFSLYIQAAALGGIQIEEFKLMLSQFADDTDLFFGCNIL